jgi:hypothetical protein
MTDRQVTLREFIARWRAGFGGGMVPFDTAYFAARREGKSEADASQLGVAALLEAIVVNWEREQAGEPATPLDAEDMPVGEECSYCNRRRLAGWACSGCPHRARDPEVAAMPDERRLDVLMGRSGGVAAVVRDAVGADWPAKGHTASWAPDSIPAIEDAMSRRVPDADG